MLRKALILLIVAAEILRGVFPHSLATAIRMMWLFRRHGSNELDGVQALA